MAGNLLRALAKRIKQIGVSLREEKPDTSVDEDALEHLVFYHGLVGSTPANQRAFRDVREELMNAIKNGSSLQAGIALKLAPLWWDEKLRTIIAEAQPKYGDERIYETLHPRLENEEWPSRRDPLGHADWRVRANAAVILSALQARQASERMARSLHDSASGAKPAFCHIAYAMGRLGTDHARGVLVEFLNHAEPWFRVDAAGALAQMPIARIGEQLMNAMLQYHPLYDYTAVAIAKYHKPAEFIASTHPSAQAGACAMIQGLIEAAKQTFNDDVVLDNDVVACAPAVFELATHNPNPLCARAAVQLARWIEVHPEDCADEVNEKANELLKVLNADMLSSIVIKTLTRSQESGSLELRSAIKLAGDFQIQAAAPLLIELLQTDTPLKELAVEALGQVGDETSVDALLTLADKTVRMPDRTSLPLSKQPIAEANEADARVYWRILESLGRIPSARALPFLLQAVSDYAPDKRAQALDSFIKCFDLLEQPADWRPKVVAAMQQSFDDPSAQVRATAVRGVEELNESSLIAEVIRLSEAQEVSVSRQALKTLSALSDNGHRAKVVNEVTAYSGTQKDPHRRKRLEDFVAGLS